MKKNNKLNVFLLLGTVALIPSFTNAANNPLIPGGSDSFYYQLGGGKAIPVPAFIDQETVPLGADGNLSLGYNCGVFDPMVSIVNSLNNIKNSFLNIEQTVIQNATAAVLEFPMYEISRANPDLYNMLNNGISGAREDLSLSTKSCQVMQNDIAQGENPYHDWSKISLGDDWKYYMGASSSSNFSSSQLASSGVDSSDINQVKNQISKDNGDTGVPWVNGTNTGRGGLYAGGKGQPAILVLHDTVIAGYNVIIGDNRAYNDTSAPAKNDKNARLVDTWSSPTNAADWITRVLGDEKVTTYSGGNKSSSPGVGLLPEIQSITIALEPKIASLVSGTTSMSLDNLRAVSAPSVMLNKAVIEYIRRLTPIERSIYVSKVSQIIATARIKDYAQLALQLLESGSQVPEIFANKAAQDNINSGIKRLNDQLQQILFNVKMNQVVANPIAALIQKIQAKQLSAAEVKAEKKSEPTMSHGAITKQQE